MAETHLRTTAHKSKTVTRTDVVIIFFERRESAGRAGLICMSIPRKMRAHEQCRKKKIQAFPEKFRADLIWEWMERDECPRCAQTHLKPKS